MRKLAITNTLDSALDGVLKIDFLVLSIIIEFVQTHQNKMKIFFANGRQKGIIIHCDTRKSISNPPSTLSVINHIFKKLLTSGLGIFDILSSPLR